MEAPAAKGYEFFDHTADVGIRASAPTLAELCQAMAQGLVELIAEDSPLQPTITRRIELTAEEPSQLLWKWLDAVLLWFEADRFLPVEYHLETATETSLRGSVRGGTFDPKQHAQGREVKAITRHQLQVEPRDGVWHGQVIVDI